MGRFGLRCVEKRKPFKRLQVVVTRVATPLKQGVNERRIGFVPGANQRVIHSATRFGRGSRPRCVLTTCADRSS